MANKLNNNNQTTNYRLYLQDRAWKDKTNFINYVNQSQNFYIGNQFPENSKSMIKAVMNICKFMVEIKASKINGTPLYLTFTADNQNTDCTALRQFDEYNCNKIGLKELNYASAINAYTNGTEVTFIRWDDDDTSYKGIYKGGLKAEHIDIRKFAVANPNIQDIQNQKWVMFWDNVSLGELKNVLEFRKGEDKKQKIEMLERDAKLSFDDESPTYDKDDINHSLVTCFSRFFRIDGEVYFTLETQSVEIFAYPHPLSRKVAKNKAVKIVEEYLKNREKDGYVSDDGDKVLDFNIDFEDMMMNITKDDVVSDEEYNNIKEKFSLYPFAVFEPIKENNSFYGRSDVKTLVPIQMGINFMISMLLKSAENNAYNKIFSKPDALQGQEITNEPSQVIYDFSNFTNGWGIKFAESQPMPNGLLDFVDRLFAMTRVVYGFNDVMDGSVTNQDMSGYMLQQMIKQSNTTIEQQQMLFWQYNVRMAEIRIMFYKHYVDKARYTFELTDGEVAEQEYARKMLYSKLARGEKLESNPNATLDDFKDETKKVQVREITNEDLYGVNFDIAVDAVQGLSDSKLVEQQFFDNLILNGGINNIRPDMLEMYIQMSPNVSPRTKQETKRMMENLKHTEIQQLENQIQRLGEKLQEAGQIIQRLDNQGKVAQAYIKNLQGEFTNKINNANKMINALQSDLDKKSAGEVKSANSRGISGEQISPQENINA